MRALLLIWKGDIWAVCDCSTRTGGISGPVTAVLKFIWLLVFPNKVMLNLVGFSQQSDGDSVYARWFFPTTGIAIPFLPCWFFPTEFIKVTSEGGN